MSNRSPFAFAIGPQPGAGWWWRAERHDGRLAEGEAPTRAAAAAFVIRIFARNHMEAQPNPDPTR